MKEMKAKKSNASFYLAFSSRGVALAVESVLILQITFYATEVLGLGVSLVGTLLLVSKLLDGVTDILMGYIIDRTHSKLGKGRPYELFMIPLGVMLVAIFSTPNFGTIGKIVYVMVLYCLIQTVCFTALNTSENVYLLHATPDENIRAKAQSIQGVLCFLISGIVGIALPIMMQSWGAEPGGWTKISAVIAVPATLIGLLRFFFVKETDVEEQIGKQEKVTLKESFNALFTNKYCLIIALALCVTASLNQLISSIGTYYFKYIFGDLSVMGIVGLVSLFSCFGILFFPIGLRKIGGANFIKLGLVVAIVGNVLKFVGNVNLPVQMIGNLLSGLGASLISMVSVVFIGQCIDYGEWKKGKRQEGVLNCVVGFSKKIGQGISSAIIGFVLGAFGFASGQAEQTANSLMGIRVCYALVPLALCVLAFAIMSFYDLEKKIPKIRKELAERK